MYNGRVDVGMDEEEVEEEVRRFLGGERAVLMSFIARRRGIREAEHKRWRIGVGSGTRDGCWVGSAVVTGAGLVPVVRGIADVVVSVSSCGASVVMIVDVIAGDVFLARSFALVRVRKFAICCHTRCG